jgi:hypothetical protein
MAIAIFLRNGSLPIPKSRQAFNSETLAHERTLRLQNLLFVEQREVRLVASVLQLVEGNEMEGGGINDVSLARRRLRVRKDVAQAGITSLGAHLGALHLVCVVGHLNEEVFRNRFRKCGQTDVAVELVD